MSTIPVALPRLAPRFPALTLALLPQRTLAGDDVVEACKGVARPNPSFTVAAPGCDAFEPAARHGELDIDDCTFPLFAPLPGVVLI